MSEERQRLASSIFRLFTQKSRFKPDGVELTDELISPSLSQGTAASLSALILEHGYRSVGQVMLKLLNIYGDEQYQDGGRKISGHLRNSLAAVISRPTDSIERDNALAFLVQQPEDFRDDVGTSVDIQTGWLNSANSQGFHIYRTAGGEIRSPEEMGFIATHSLLWKAYLRHAVAAQDSEACKTLLGANNDLLPDMRATIGLVCLLDGGSYTEMTGEEVIPQSVYAASMAEGIRSEVAVRASNFYDRAINEACLPSILGGISHFDFSKSLNGFGNFTRLLSQMIESGEGISEAMRYAAFGPASFDDDEGEHLDLETLTAGMLAAANRRYSGKCHYHMAILSMIDPEELAKVSAGQEIMTQLVDYVGGKRYFKFIKDRSLRLKVAGDTLSL